MFYLFMMILLSIVALVTLGFAGTAYYREKRNREDDDSVTFWLRVTVIDFALMVLITVFNCM